MSLQVDVSARSGDLRCAYCHEAVAEAAQRTCPTCSLALHPECWSEVGGCPGCRSGAGGRPLVTPRPRPPRRPRVRCYRCVERLGEAYELCQGCGWAFDPGCFELRDCCAVGSSETEARRRQEAWRARRERTRLQRGLDTARSFLGGPGLPVLLWSILFLVVAAVIYALRQLSVR